MRNATVAVGAFALAGSAFAEEKRVRSMMLSTGRRMEWLELGGGETPCIFVHGFLGSGDTYETIDPLLKQHGISAIAPNLYGDHTEWWKKDCVQDAGDDIAALAQVRFGRTVRPTIISCSAGVKEGIATCIALNKRGDALKVPALYAVSGQVDLGRRDVFNLLNGEEQYTLNAIRGVPIQARFPIAQPIRNIGARLKKRIAHRKIQKMAHTPLAAKEVTSKFSRHDMIVLNSNPTFRDALFEDAAEYSYNEIINSIQRLYHWNLAFGHLQGTHIHIMHGTDDRLVKPGNAGILRSIIAQAGVRDVDVQMYEGYGHLLLKARAEEMIERVEANRK